VTNKLENEKEAIQMNETTHMSFESDKIRIDNNEEEKILMVKCKDINNQFKSLKFKIA